MSTTVTANFSVPSGVLSNVASDVGDTGVLDVGDGTGLGTGNSSELASGFPAYPTLNLEILVGTSTQNHADAWAPIEVGTGLSRQAPAQVESVVSVRSDTVVPAEATALFSVDARDAIEQRASVIREAFLPTESGSMAVGTVVPMEWLAPSQTADGRFTTEFGRQLVGDCPLIAEKLTAIFRDPDVLIELLPVSRIDASALIEAAPSVSVRAEALLPIEISHRLSADLPIASEIRGVYLVNVSFVATLSDGRVITFAAAAAPAAGSS
jgi:hypothetical protein